MEIRVDSHFFLLECYRVPMTDDVFRCLSKCVKDLWCCQMMPSMSQGPILHPEERHNNSALFDSNFAPFSSPSIEHSLFPAPVHSDCMNGTCHDIPNAQHMHAKYPMVSDTFYEKISGKRGKGICAP